MTLQAGPPSVFARPTTGRCVNCVHWAPNPKAFPGDPRLEPMQDGTNAYDPCHWSTGKFTDGFEDAGFCKLAANDYHAKDYPGSDQRLALPVGHEDAEAGLMCRPQYGCVSFSDVAVSPGSVSNDRQAMLDLLGDIGARVKAGQMIGIVFAVCTGRALYDLKWAGWNDPTALAGAFDLAKFILIQDFTGAGRSVASTEEARRGIAPSEAVTEIRPEESRKRLQAVAELVDVMTGRAARGEISGLVVAMHMSASVYTVSWKGWNDPVVAAGAMDFASHALFRSYTSGG